MFGRLKDSARSAGRLIRQRSNRIIAAVAALVGVDEIGLVLGLALLSVGARMVWPPAGSLAPAAVLLWIYLPQRVPFIHRERTERRPQQGPAKEE